jgi:DNA-binding NarL/FixJ family response regulator
MSETRPVRPGHLPPGDRARIVIADDDRLFATELAEILESHEEFDVVGFAEDGAEALALVRELEPAVVVMAVSIPVLDGAEATRRMRDLPSAPEVVLLTTEDTKAADPSIYESGASAYVSKADAPSVIDVIAGVTRLRRTMSLWRALPRLRSLRRT